MLWTGSAPRRGRSSKHSIGAQDARDYGYCLDLAKNAFQVRGLRQMAGVRPAFRPLHTSYKRPDTGLARHASHDGLNRRGDLVAGQGTSPRPRLVERGASVRTAMFVRSISQTAFVTKRPWAATADLQVLLSLRWRRELPSESRPRASSYREVDAVRGSGFAASDTRTPPRPFPRTRRRQRPLVQQPTPGTQLTGRDPCRGQRGQRSRRAQLTQRWNPIANVHCRTRCMRRRCACRRHACDPADENFNLASFDPINRLGHVFNQDFPFVEGNCVACPFPFQFRIDRCPR